MAVKKERKKTECPVSREEFNKESKIVKITIGDTTLLAEPKEFSSGSIGWYCNQKVVVELGGKQVKCQAGINLTIIGSKDLPVPPK